MENTTKTMEDKPIQRKGNGVREALKTFPKLHKCTIYDYKTSEYLGKVHTFSFPEKGETIIIPTEPETVPYKVKRREYTANTQDRTLSCELYVKQIRKGKSKKHSEQ